MTNRTLKVFLLRLAVSALCAGAGFAQTVPLTADTYFVPLSSGNNGAAQFIKVDGPTSAQALIQFDLSTLPADTTSANIAKATLVLFVKSVGPGGTINISTANGSWSEYTVNGTNNPVAGAAVSSGLSVSGSGGYLYVDVTNAVEGWITTPSSNHGFLIASADGTSSIQFDSKESTTTSHPASLTVTLSASGATGATGATGSNGTNGTNGATGATGATGSNGTNGTNGATGATGATGSNGTNGTNGATGATGATGSNGTNGTNGATGATGATGSNGTNGANGAAGATGPTGSNGTNGTNGATGATGATGSNGTNGTNGATGATGATGSNGTNGTNGATGATGATGSNGTNGANGAAGATGPTGSNGTNGTNGATGATGATGSNGTNGTNGATGPTGATGSNGTNGTNGATGATGSNGANGATGSNGANGSAGATGPTGAVSTNYFEFNVSFNDSNISSGSPYYFPPLHSANTNGSTSLSFANGNVVVSPLACTISQLAVGSMVTAAGVTIGQATVTLMQGHNSVTPTASAVTCTTGTSGTALGSQQSCVDNTHTVSIAAGDTLSLKLVEPSQNGSTATISYYNIHLRCQ